MYIVQYNNRHATDLSIKKTKTRVQFDGLVEDCSISSVIAIEILQSCTEPSNCYAVMHVAEIL